MTNPTPSPDDARLQIEDDPLASRPGPGVGLSLSGGGYKAALFHLGGLIRLNELGTLPRLSRVSSVSGGSITAAWLGLNWSRLRFDASGRAANFDEVVWGPIVRFTTEARIDVWAGLRGVLDPSQTTGEALARAYETHLFGKATLQDLPDPAEGAPTFVLNATNMQLNSLWRFSRIRAADHRIGEVRSPRFSLAKVVAASSGFPPVFSPVVFTFADGEVTPLPGADRGLGPFLRRAVVADGGIYDNLGLESVWKRYETLLVSNAGDPFDELEAPPIGWLGQVRRVISILHRQGENHRLRWLIALAQSDHRTVAAWSLRNGPGSYAAPGALSLGEAEIARVGRVGVRLWPPHQGDRELLTRHGYAMADAAVRRFWLTQAPAPTGWPSFPSLLGQAVP